MNEGVKKVDTISKGMDNIGIKDRSMIFNTDLVEALELENLMQQAIVTRSQLTKEKNRVVHILTKTILKEMIRMDETYNYVA